MQKFMLDLCRIIIVVKKEKSKHKYIKSRKAYTKKICTEICRLCTNYWNL